MSNAIQISPVIDQLESILNSGNVPAPYDRWGARLLSHLSRPVQIVVTGFSGSGKSALIEMLSGQPVLGHRSGIPVTELTYGEAPRALFERPDGSVRTVAGFLKDHPVPEGTTRMRQELPDTLLLRQSYVEIALAGTKDQKRTALEHAVSRADLMIWCTDRFDAEEQSLWSDVPDAIKDQSLIALTMADRQMMRGNLSETIERLHPVVASEFLGLFPVATIQGITAQTSGEVRDETLWSSSGGKYLMDQVSRQVSQGRMADTDRAQIFLDRLNSRSDIAVQTTDRQTEKQTLIPSDPEGQLPAAAGETMTILTQAITLLQEQAGKMLDQMDHAEDLDTDGVISGCTAALAPLSHLLGAASPADQALNSARDDVEEGEEMLMLFQLERGEEAAFDAVTLLLQLRNEIGQRAAS